MTTQHFHDTNEETYDALVALFGEESPSDPTNATRWVEVGAGTVRLVFFAPRVRHEALQRELAGVAS